MKIFYFISAALLSCLLYTLIFLFVLHKPLTVGLLGEYLTIKLDYLSTVDESKRIIIFAGSNGRFSHRCETIQKKLFMPCINMSVAADISLNYQFNKIKPLLAMGDIIYMPLEYSQYNQNKVDIMTSTETPYIVAYDKNYFLQMDLERQLRALFFFDIRFILSALGEMTLQELGIQRRFSAETLTIQGDEKTHTLAKARKYRSFLKSLRWSPPAPEKIDLQSASARTLIEFMDWATEHHITVIGGLPTAFDDKPIAPEVVKKLCQLYTDRQHGFLVLPNLSQYPRENFYDARSHLAEEYQIRHSSLIAEHFTKDHLAIIRKNDDCDRNL